MRLIAVLAAVSLAGCATGVASGVAVPASTTPDEYRSYLTTGTGVIEGRAFAKRSGESVIVEGPLESIRLEDDVRVAAKQPVTLDPATPYAMEWYRRYGNSIARFEAVPTDSLFRRARRTTVSDENGRFRFEGLPPGEYIVRTRITWMQPRDQFRAERRGGVAGTVIQLDAGEQKTVSLNGMVAPPTVY